MAKAAKQSLIVTVSKDRNIKAIARDLKAAGLEIEEVLDAIGIVTGRARFKELASDQGVLQKCSLPESDAEICSQSESFSRIILHL
jgi:hypothetical protein